MQQSIYIYSDESGVFDKKHQKVFVYSGIACMGQDKSSILSRKYLEAEKNLRKSMKYKNMPELKACLLKIEAKRKLYRIIKDCYKFVVVIELQKLQDERFVSRQSQQRYLDYALKRGIKKLLLRLDEDNIIDLKEEIEIKCYVDEHARATNGKYSLRDSIYQEFKMGVHINGYDIKPIAPKLSGVYVSYCNSETTALVRAADILSNRLLNDVREDLGLSAYLNDNLLAITYLP